MAIIKRCLGRQDQQLIATPTQAKQELYNTVDGSFDTLNKKFHQNIMKL